MSAVLADGAGTEPEERRIRIPAGHKLVELRSSELPEDDKSLDDLFDFLWEERAPLETWLEIALEFHRLHGQRPHAKEFFERTLRRAEKLLQSGRHAEDAEVATLNALAAQRISSAVRLTDGERRTKLLTDATSYLSRADNIPASLSDPVTWIAKGLLHLARQEPANRVGPVFTSALELDPGNTAAMLGLACVDFNEGNVKSALSRFRSALSDNPRAPWPVRFGLGLCYWRLKQVKQARACFQRVLQLDDSVVCARVALALLHLNEESSEAIQAALGLLRDAYKLSPTDPMVLNYLADHYFYRGRFETVRSLALQAYHATTLKRVQAESCFQVGRSYQASGEFESAFQHFYQATRLWPGCTLAQYGLGQMYIDKGDFAKATECFQTVLDEYPDNYEALRTKGAMLAVSNDPNLAVPVLKRVLELYPDDTESVLHLAEIAETADPKQSLVYYERAVTLIATRGAQPPVELVNNVGVMRHVTGQFDGAAKAFLTALDADLPASLPADQLKAKLEELVKPEQHLTLLYNLARVREDQRHTLAAETIYKAILAHWPLYTDALKRLGEMAERVGRQDDARSWYSKILDAEPESVDAHLLLGNLAMKQREYQEAQKQFEAVTNSANAEIKHDAYAQIGLANMWYLNTQRGVDVMDDRTKYERRKRYLSRARGFYLKVLKAAPRNVFAANGVAIVMAEEAGDQMRDEKREVREAGRSKMEQAKAIFQRATESCDDVANVWLNLAYAYLQLGKPRQAVNVYQNCSSKFFGNDNASVLQALAEALFHDKQFRECQRVLKRAIHLTPHNHQLWYDLAVAQQAAARHLLERPADNPATSADLTTVLAGLKAAESCFRWLSTCSPVRGRTAYHFVPKAAADRADYLSNSMIPTTEQAIEYAAYQEQEVLRRIEHQRMMYEQQVQREKEDREAAQEAARQQKLREQDQARQLEHRARRAMEMNEAAASAMQQSKESSKRKRAGGGGGGGAGAGGKSGTTKRKRGDTPPPSSDSESDAEGAAAKRARLAVDPSEDNDGNDDDDSHHAAAPAANGSSSSNGAGSADDDGRDSGSKDVAMSDADATGVDDGAGVGDDAIE